MVRETLARPGAASPYSSGTARSRLIRDVAGRRPNSWRGPLVSHRDVRSFLAGLLVLVAAWVSALPAAARPDPSPRAAYGLEGVPVVVPPGLEPQTPPGRVARAVLREYRRGGAIEALTLYPSQRAFEASNPRWGRGFGADIGPVWYADVSGYVQNCRALGPGIGPCPFWYTAHWIVRDSDASLWGFGAP